MKVNVPSIRLLVVGIIGGLASSSCERSDVAKPEAGTPSTVDKKEGKRDSSLYPVSVMTFRDGRTTGIGLRQERDGPVETLVNVIYERANGSEKVHAYPQVEMEYTESGRLTPGEALPLFARAEDALRGYFGAAELQKIRADRAWYGNGEVMREHLDDPVFQNRQDASFALSIIDDYRTSNAEDSK